MNTIAHIRDASNTISVKRHNCMAVSPLVLSAPMVAPDEYHAAGLESDNTVVAVGRSDGRHCDVGAWILK